MPPHTIDVRLSSPMALKRKILAMTTTSQFSLPTPLLSWEPTNEQEVVLLFGYLLHYGALNLPRPIIIESVGTTFPDCKARALDGGKEEIWIEFELLSGAYEEHIARHEKCDWIVCWKDYPTKSHRSQRWPEIVALEGIVRKFPGQIIRNLRHPDLTDADYFRRRIETLSDHHKSVIARVWEFAEEHHLRIELRSNGARCTACRDDGLELFTISVNGRISTPFSRWGGFVTSSEKSWIVRELNAATGWTFHADGKLGADIAQLLPDGRVERYLDTWRRFLEGQR
jgi:hypothetical protein